MFSFLVIVVWDSISIFAKIKFYRDGVIYKEVYIVAYD